MFIFKFVKSQHLILNESIKCSKTTCLFSTNMSDPTAQYPLWWIMVQILKEPGSGSGKFLVWFYTEIVNSDFRHTLFIYSEPEQPSFLNQNQRRHSGSWPGLWIWTCSLDVDPGIWSHIKEFCTSFIHCNHLLES